MLCHRKQERGDFISFRLVPITVLLCRAYQGTEAVYKGDTNASLIYTENRSKMRGKDKRGHRRRGQPPG